MASEGAANTAIRRLRDLGRVIPAISLLLRCQRASFPQGLPFWRSQSTPPPPPPPRFTSTVPLAGPSALLSTSATHTGSFFKLLLSSSGLFDLTGLHIQILFRSVKLVGSKTIKKGDFIYLSDSYIDFQEIILTAHTNTHARTHAHTRTHTHTHHILTLPQSHARTHTHTSVFVN